MCESMKRTVRMILGAGTVMAVLLAAQPGMAHTPDSPSCSGLPTAEDFFDGTNETASIVPNTLNPALATKQGTGSAAKGGNTKYRYAKITVPQLAAGELRVFDTRASGANASDAVLCQGTSTRAQYRTSHPSSHRNAESARTAALTAQMKASEAGADADITESQARSALRNAASALSSAASALRRAATALTNADLDSAATTATTAANEAYDTAAEDDAYDDASVAAGTNVGTRTGVATDGSPDDEKTALTTAATALTDTVTALRNAANALHDVEAVSTVFQLRAEVRPGDQEYILVTTGQDIADVPTPLAVQFHGAIAAADVQRERSLNAGDQHTYFIAVTAPGLLTVETTGSTDTAGMLGAAITAMDDDSGDGNNFRMVVPMTQSATSYTLTVDGQTPTTTGDYTLDMDFKVAMQDKATNSITGVDPTPIALPTGVMIPGAPTWTSTAADFDDEVLQIEKIAEDGRTDEDYFLFTIDANASGFLTVETMDDNTSADDSNTKGTLYGPTGEITEDTRSGAGDHFKIRAPVEEGLAYLVKVEGTDGVYRLNIALDQAQGNDLIAVPGAQGAPASVDCSANNNDPGEICEPAAGAPLERELYVFEVEEPGALYVHTIGNIDTVGTLYGPDGSEIASDDNSGEGNNFRIAANVNAGLHLVEVRGKTRMTEGTFTLVTNHVTGEEVDEPTPPPTQTDPPPTTIDPNPTGDLDEPPHNGVRSGIGLIRGWVCQDDGNGVEIRIMDADGDRVATFTAPYGSDRGDVDVMEHCGRRVDGIGFAVQYNYNLLPAGTYTIEAYVGRDQVESQSGGRTNTFRVVRISNEEVLTRVQSGRIRVEGFPRTGNTTILEWDQQSQNFQIVDFE